MPQIVVMSTHLAPCKNDQRPAFDASKMKTSLPMRNWVMTCCQSKHNRLRCVPSRCDNVISKYIPDVLLRIVKIRPCVTMYCYFFYPTCTNFNKWFIFHYTVYFTVTSCVSYLVKYFSASNIIHSKQNVIICLFT